MLFNSLPFLIFLPTVFLLYWFVFNRYLKWQNGFVLIASYVFYGWWDYRFLGLVVASTLVDFLLGIALDKQQVATKRKLLLVMSLIFNLGFLAFFKYYHFFMDSWVEAWGFLGITMSATTLKIILPVGISFYTFQTLSYTIDVYRKQIQPTKDFLSFAAYVAFFPQLVAGPIERAKSLLPQFEKARVFDYELAKSGLHLIVWGLFKKVVVADTCAFFVSLIFSDPTAFSSLELWMGALLFGFQIYGDFSGYSDIAIGTARLFGFRLMTNFKFPYFSRDIGEFWRRWHISLSTWFRDYVYIPLGGSRVSKYKQIRNVFVVFLISGFWHGAEWTFIFWGAIHAVLFLPLMLLNKHKVYLPDTDFKPQQVLSLLTTFLVVTIAWVFFRADTLFTAMTYLKDMFSFKTYSLSLFFKSSKYMLFILISVFSILTMLIIEFQAFKQHRDEVVLSSFKMLFVALLIVFLGVFKNPADFIYFQF